MCVCVCAYRVHELKHTTVTWSLGSLMRFSSLRTRRTTKLFGRERDRRLFCKRQKLLCPSLLCMHKRDLSRWDHENQQVYLLPHPDTHTPHAPCRCATREHTTRLIKDHLPQHHRTLPSHRHPSAPPNRHVVHCYGVSNSEKTSLLVVRVRVRACACVADSCDRANLI